MSIAPGLDRGQLQKIGLLAVLAAMLIAASFLVDNFCTGRNFSSILRNVANVVIVSSAMTLLVLSKGIDLSVGSVTALVSVVSALACQWYVPWPAAIIVGMGSGLVVGLTNSVLVNRFQVNPILTTLATMTSVRGLAYVLAGGLPVPMQCKALEWLAEGEVGYVPVPTLLAVVIVAVLWLIQSRTAFGVRMIAVGGNEAAARLCGIPVARIRNRLYLLTSLCAAVAGWIVIGRHRSGQPEAGTGMEFDVITAVVVGGTSLDGGVGSVLGTVVGAVFIAVVSNIMILLGASSYVQLVAKGLIIVAAILVDQRVRRMGE